MAARKSRAKKNDDDEVNDDLTTDKPVKVVLQDQKRLLSSLLYAKDAVFWSSPTTKAQTKRREMANKDLSEMISLMRKVANV